VIRRSRSRSSMRNTCSNSACGACFQQCTRNVCPFTFDSELSI
jgi:hypothetical protein